MNKSFSTMKTNIGRKVMDTSSTFATELGKYINKVYTDILRAVNWEYIRTNYTVSAVAGTQDYALPEDFGKELYVHDDTNGVELDRTILEHWLMKVVLNDTLYTRM